MKMLATMLFDPGRRAEVISLIPEERARIGQLREAGTILERYLQSDLSRVWLILEGVDEAAIRQAIESLPLYGFVTYLDLADLAG